MTKCVVGILSLCLAFLLIFSIPAIKALYRNAFLTQEAPATEMKWSLRKTGAEEWGIGVEYKYNVDGVAYQGEEIFEGERFKNPYKAESRIKELEAAKWPVWYMPKNPSWSTVEKYFPTKRVVYTALLALVFGWGLYIGRMFVQSISNDLRK